jgi:hypothetical protein
MTTENKVGGPEAWANAFVGLFVWDRLGGTLFKVTRVDVNVPWVWYGWIRAYGIGKRGGV